VKSERVSKFVDSVELVSSGEKGDTQESGDPHE
jgi:hypothetical protein